MSAATASDKGKAVVGELGISTLPWIEKYRPADLEDLISHKDIISTILRLINENQLPHLLFYGPPGTGKTSTVLAIAKRLFGTSYKSNILELNASDDRGIDVVREQIISFASTRQIFSTGIKLIILDEADSMTQPAQAALRRVMEKYTKNVRFCIICNYVSKIIPAIQSRCTRFRFAPLALDQIDSRVQSIAEQESVQLTEDGKQALLRLSNGDMRRVLNIMQSTHIASGVVSEETVYMCTGTPLPVDIERIVTWLLAEDFSMAHQYINKMKMEKGIAMADIVSEVFKFSQTVEFPRATRVFLNEQLADIEYRLTSGCSEKIQLSSLISAFQLGKELAGRHQISL